MVAKNNKNDTSDLALINNILSAQASALTAYASKATGYCGDKSATKALINGALAGLVRSKYE